MKGEDGRARSDEGRAERDGEAGEGEDNGDDGGGCSAEAPDGAKRAGRAKAAKGEEAPDGVEADAGADQKVVAELRDGPSGHEGSVTRGGGGRGTAQPRTVCVGRATEGTEGAKVSAAGSASGCKREVVARGGEESAARAMQILGG
jgi:hypothetical protein